METDGVQIYPDVFLVRFVAADSSCACDSGGSNTECCLRIYLKKIVGFQLAKLKTPEKNLRKPV
jgi:hypothetical protein